MMLKTKKAIHTEILIVPLARPETSYTTFTIQRQEKFETRENDESGGYPSY